MSKVMKDLKMNKRVEQVCILRQCGEQRFWGRGRCKNTYSEGQCSFFSVLLSMVAQLDIHCNIVEAFISNVVSVTGVKCERKILCETLVGRTCAYMCV